ncbi:hypothetical protein MKFW12EY_19720 [Methylomonas koyamae]|nr:hypothetical protein MKFW12EY_19720 [Methylomonas koyamae]
MKPESAAAFIIPAFTATAHRGAVKVETQNAPAVAEVAVKDSKQSGPTKYFGWVDCCS